MRAARQFPSRGRRLPHTRLALSMLAARMHRDRSRSASCCTISPSRNAARWTATRSPSTATPTTAPRWRRTCSRGSALALRAGARRLPGAQSSAPDHGAADAPVDAQADARRGRLRRVARMSRSWTRSPPAPTSASTISAARDGARWAASEIRPPRLLGGNDLIAMGFTPGPRFQSNPQGRRGPSTRRRAGDPRSARIDYVRAHYGRRPRRLSGRSACSTPATPGASAARSRSTASTSTRAPARFTRCSAKTARARPR